MQNELAAVAPVSLSKVSCVYCAADLESFVAEHCCSRCNRPQPVQPSMDYFSLFGLTRRFEIHLGELEKKFYQISRLLHPDRFVAADPLVREASVQRMSFLNQAYTTLKNPELLRDYLMTLENISPPSQQVALAATGDLAEAWFELQESLEDPQFRVDGQAFKIFETKLAETKIGVVTEMTKLERSYDQNPSADLLNRIALESQKLNYLKSLARDVERIKKHGSSN